MHGTLSPFATAIRELLRIKTSWPDRILSNVIGQVLWVHWLIGNIGVGWSMIAGDEYPRDNACISASPICGPEEFSDPGPSNVSTSI